MNRRNLLTVAAASVMLPGAVMAREGGQTAHPDADLLVLAARFIAHERAIQAMPCDAKTEAEEKRHHTEQRRMVSIQHALALQLGTLRATTADGIAAWARCLAVHNSDGAFSMEDPNTTTGRLLRYLMRDAGALDGMSAQPPPPSPDAALLAACAAHDDLERAYLATGFGHESDTPECDAAEAEQMRISAAQEPYADRICQARPVTWKGHVARARTLALCDPDLFQRAADYTNEAMLAAIVRDLIGEGGASRPSVVPQVHTRINAKRRLNNRPIPGGDFWPTRQKCILLQRKKRRGKRRFSPLGRV